MLASTRNTLSLSDYASAGQPRHNISCLRERSGATLPYSRPNTAHRVRRIFAQAAATKHRQRRHPPLRLGPGRKCGISAKPVKRRQGDIGNSVGLDGALLYRSETRRTMSWRKHMYHHPPRIECHPLRLVREFSLRGLSCR